MTTIRRLAGYAVGAVCLGAMLSFTAINTPANLGEEGLFELAQVGFVALAVVLWLVRGPAQWSINVFVATVGLLFLGREAYGGSDALVEALK